mmetsp:Transcript_8501/g.16279  ORF Transcript_8501/g.16279 Transcript_8501/m.16279 type:complete len:194 (-) Transcript_8501:227-808(-)
MRHLLYLLAPMIANAAVMAFYSNEPRGVFSANITDPCMNNSTCYEMVQAAVQETLDSGDYLPTSSPVVAPTSVPTPAPKGNGNGNGKGNKLRGRRQLITCTACMAIHNQIWICTTFFQCTGGMNRRELLSYTLSGATESETEQLITDSCFFDHPNLTPPFHDSVMSKLPQNDPIFQGIEVKLQVYSLNCGLLF